jgi:Domain of unknown function (DUF1995)
MPLPNSLDDAVAQAREATAAAIAAGYTRLQVELLFPELKIMPVAEQFLPAFEQFGSQLRVYFRQHWHGETGARSPLQFAE